MGHPDGAGPAATAWQGTAPCGEPPTPIATNFRLIVLQVRRYLKMCLFVLISRKDIILGALLREVSLLCGVHCFSQVSWRPFVKHTHGPTE